MTRSSEPSRSPSPRAGVLLAGLLLVLGVLCVALRIPVADALAPGLSAAEWSPPAAYPPFAAILFAPAAWLPTGVLKAVLVGGSAGLFALLILLSCRPVGLRARPGPVLAATVAGLWLEPLFQTPLSGQIALALACPVLWDLHRPRGALGKGFALGTAAGITLTPALLIPYLLLTGQVRAGLTALGAFAGSGLLGLLVLPGASAEFWSRHPPAGGRSLLLDWPHLWVWTVPLLTALLAAGLRLRARLRMRLSRPAAGAGAGEPTGGKQAVAEGVPAPRDQPSASSSSASMIR